MEKTKPAKQQQKKQAQPKVQKIQKFALLSPFLTYAEVMPSKPSKDLCQKSLVSFLQYLTQNEVVVENYESQKKPKLLEQHPPKVSIDEIKALKKEKRLAFGLRDV